MILTVVWAGSQRPRLNVSVVVSDATSFDFCPWLTAMLVTISDHKCDDEVQENRE